MGQDMTFEREDMVKRQLLPRGIIDERVLTAMRSVPRHRFVPEHLILRAYTDNPLPIGEGQTISQPYIVALQTELCRLDKQSRVLEIGTGSGYQTAVLSETAGAVFTVELLPNLLSNAKDRLFTLAYENIHFRLGDGYEGWPDEAPYDAILVTAAPAAVPPALLEQLASGGRLVIPVGEYEQYLMRITKQPDGTFLEEPIIPVRFVPLVPRA